MTEAPTAAMLVIGDEILSGRTRDSNSHHLANRLTEKGIALREIRVVADDQTAIVDALNELRARHTWVFTSGGIGPTHDDITADCVAAAFGVGIDIREDARAILATNYANPAVDLNAARLRMARIPDGATLIDNPVSKAPGFTLGNVHVMAGVPAVFHAMVESVLPDLTGGAPLLSESIRIDRPEGEIASDLATIDAAHPDVSRWAATPRSATGASPPRWWPAARTPASLASAVHDIRALSLRAHRDTAPCAHLPTPRGATVGRCAGGRAGRSVRPLRRGVFPPPRATHKVAADAGVMELVDIPDLKSGGPGPCGFESRRPHHDLARFRLRSALHCLIQATRRKAVKRCPRSPRNARRSPACARG